MILYIAVIAETIFFENEKLGIDFGEASADLELQEKVLCIHSSIREI